MWLLYFLSTCFPCWGMLIICLYFCIKRTNVFVNAKYLVFPLSFIYGMFGYAMIPIAETDLTRYFYQIDSIGSLSLIDLFKKDTDYLYLRDVLFYFVHKCGDNHLLSFIVGFIIYGIVFYVYFDMIQRYEGKISKRDIFLVGILTVGIISPYSIIGNVRCILSYVLVSFATYRDLVQNKKDFFTIILYFFPLGLHVSTIIVLAIRISLFLTKRLGKLIWGMALFMPTLIILGYKYSVVLGSSIWSKLIKNAIFKAYYYLNWTEGGWADIVDKSISNKINRYYGVFFILIILYLIFSRNIKEDENNELIIYQMPMVRYLSVISICALGCLSIKTGAFWRFEAIAVLFSSVYMIPLLQNKNIFRVKLCTNLLFLSSVCMFLLNSIYQVRNLKIIETLSRFFFTSGFQVIFEMIRGVLS